MKKEVMIAVSVWMCAVLLGGCGVNGSTREQEAAVGTSVPAEDAAEALSEAEPDGISEAGAGKSSEAGAGKSSEAGAGKPSEAGAGQASEAGAGRPSEAGAEEPSQGGADQASGAGQEVGAALPDGIYTAEFHTDSSMFHVSEACGGKGTLTVEGGKMVIHISLGSKRIVNLYPGLAEDARKDGAELLMPTEDTVTYSDGMTEEVYGFDVPVPVLGEEFDLALIGTKETWYDHKVSVSNPVPEAPVQTEDGVPAKGAAIPADGIYSMELIFEGGSGRAEILSPATVTVTGGNATATLRWSSPNYDYMVVEGEKYLPVNTEGNSVFEIPVLRFDEPMDVIGDTVAMSKPHEVEYTLTFLSDTIEVME